MFAKLIGYLNRLSNVASLLTKNSQSAMHQGCKKR